MGRERNSSVVYFTSSWIIHGSARRNTTLTPTSFGTNASVCSWICVTACNDTHDETNQQRDDQHRPGDEQGEHDRVAREVDDERV